MFALKYICLTGFNSICINTNHSLSISVVVLLVIFLPLSQVSRNHISSLSPLIKLDLLYCASMLHISKFDKLQLWVFSFFFFLSPRHSLESIIFLSQEKEKIFQLQCVCAVTVFWNNHCAAVMSDRLENVCHVAKDFWWLTWKTEKHRETLRVTEQWEKMLQF